MLYLANVPCSQTPATPSPRILSQVNVVLSLIYYLFKFHFNIIPLPLSEDQLWGSPSLLSNGYRASIPGGKARSGRDADDLTPSSTKVKNE
jgi:hypothetical protein